MKTDNYFIGFLHSFFRIFQARIEEFELNGSAISGVISWGDEVQQFLWDIPENNNDIENSISLINYLIKNNLIKGDMITISKETLISILLKYGWELSKIENAINYVCSVRVAMINEGQVSDNFLIHF